MTMGIFSGLIFIVLCRWWTLYNQRMLNTEDVEINEFVEIVLQDPIKVSKHQLLGISVQNRVPFAMVVDKVKSVA